ncbi:MAG: hypothetical protein IID45_13250, partial [Planctomycetes bacterium]|nr:hypothetical protein [Planctomycetota bacterium]
MKSLSRLSVVTKSLALLTLCAAVLVSATAFAAKKRTRRQRPITRPRFDPTAERVELFQGIKDGSLSVRMILKNSLKGTVLIENKTKKPLTVVLPKAVVGVQVLKQGVGGMGIGGAPGAGGAGGVGQGGGQGQNQPAGGGFGGGGGQGGYGQGGGQGGGNNFFSIP